MAKTLRVRTKAGWVTKPAEDIPENRLTSEEVDDNFLALESQIESLDGGEQEFDRVLINTPDDGVNDLQVGGPSSFRGDVGIGTDTPYYDLDVNGSARIREGSSLEFGGNGSNDAEMKMVWNPETKTLDLIVE